MRTFDDCLDFVVNAHNLFVDSGYFVVNTVRKFQDLCGCHKRFIMREFVQSLQSVLNISPPQYLLQIFFCMKSVRENPDIYLKESTDSLIVV